MKISAKFTSITVIIIVIIVALIIVTNSKRTEASFTVLKKQDALETVLANGRIAGRKVVPLGFVRSGLVTRVIAKDGQAVKRGDTLAMLDNAVEKAAISQRYTAVKIARINQEKLGAGDAVRAQEAYNQAQSREASAKSNLDRATQLYNNQAVSTVDLESAQQAYDQAVSQSKVAKSNLDELGSSQRPLLESQTEQAIALLKQAEIDLSKCFLRAPEDGKVLELKAATGEIISSGQPICTFIASDTSTHVELLIDENEVMNVKVGQRAVVSIIALENKIFEAVVRDVLPVIDPSRGTATVQLQILSTNQEFIPDQTVSAQIITGTKPGVLAVEQRFVLTAGQNQKAYKYQNGRAIETVVSAKDLGDGKVIIEKGLTEGDTLLFAPKLKTGDRVALK